MWSNRGRMGQINEEWDKCNEEEGDKATAEPITCQKRKKSGKYVVLLKMRPLHCSAGS